MKAMRRLAGTVFIWMLSLFFLVPPLRASAYEAVHADIVISCKRLTGSISHKYEIMIEPSDASCPVPSSDHLEILGNQKGKFTLELTEPGTFTYKIYEKKGSDQSIIYDDSVYTVSVFVENGEFGELVYAVTALKDSAGSKHEKIEFGDMGDEDIRTQVTTAATTQITLNTTASTGVTEITEPEDETDVTEPETEATAADTTALTTAAETDATEAHSDDQTTETTAATTKTESLVSRIGNVFTGDNSPVGKLFGIMTAAVLTGGIAMFVRRKKQN